MIDEYQLSRELDYLCASSWFSNKPQMKRLLEYLVSHALSADEKPFDQRAIAIEGLGRGDDFDPAENPLVRIEVGRLRRLLNKAYLEDHKRPFMITVPLRQYRPEIIQPSLPSPASVLPALQGLSENDGILTVLLQFNTEGIENAGLYLLRHQIRIGLTLQIKRLDGIRLVVAIPSMLGTVESSVDVVIKASLSQLEAHYLIRTEANWQDENTMFFDVSQKIPLIYEQPALESNLSNLVSRLLDEEIGVVWDQWLVKHQHYRNDVHPSPEKAIFHYLLYFRQGGEASFSSALTVARTVMEQYPSYLIVKSILADLYYQGVLHGYGSIKYLLGSGIGHARVAVRSHPRSLKIHAILASLSYFLGQNNLAEAQFRQANETSDVIYSVAFHRSLLTCLAFDWSLGFQELKSLVQEFDRYPDIFPVMAFMDAVGNERCSEIEHWRAQLNKLGLSTTVRQLVHLIRYPEQLGVSREKDELWDLMKQHLKTV